MGARTEHEPIIRVEGLCLGYGDKVLFDRLDFDVRRGEVFVVLGRSGCGKSTLLMHMVGLHRAAAGRILIGGEDIVTAEGDDLRRILRGIGVMYQTGALFGSMTLLENVRLPLEELTSLPREAMDLVARMKLDLVNLRAFESYFPAEISGGMRKRAAIARALALDPQIVFLDEPSAGLDPITSAELDHLVLHLSRHLGVTFVVVTHELSSVYAIADRVVMLDKEAKDIIATGTPTELRRSEDVRVSRFFNREAGPITVTTGEG